MYTGGNAVHVCNAILIVTVRNIYIYILFIRTAQGTCTIMHSYMLYNTVSSA